MIGYFTDEGDNEVGAFFNPYLESFNRLLKRNLKDKDYGSGLDLILIQYRLEGKYLKLPPDQYKVLAYRKKERSASVVVGVPLDFRRLSDAAKKRFIIDSTLESAILVRVKMLRLGFKKIDFDSLIHDINETAEEFLGLDSST